MLAVGAAPWYDVRSIESYSSRGPTPDGRVKPDIVGADLRGGVSGAASRRPPRVLRYQPGGAARGWNGSIGAPAVPPVQSGGGCRLPEEPRRAAWEGAAQQHLGVRVRKTPGSAKELPTQLGTSRAIINRVILQRVDPGLRLGGPGTRTSAVLHYRPRWPARHGIHPRVR